ncbi:hypothetical protein COCCADRAFT_87900, partial [Bipolaris zeicola 26-R-13]
CCIAFCTVEILFVVKKSHTVRAKFTCIFILITGVQRYTDGHDDECVTLLRILPCPRFPKSYRARRR